MSALAQFYKDKVLFITGCTGIILDDVRVSWESVIRENTQMCASNLMCLRYD